MNGIILSVVAGVYRVLIDDKIYNITPKGKFRHLKIKPMVGDYCTVEDGVIVALSPRKNELFRPSICNLDYGIVVSSLKEPEYSSYLNDKFITLLKMNHITPLLVLSKCDLESDREKLERIKKEYESIGIQVVFFSKKTMEGVDELKTLIKGKVVAFTGQTGVGKSSLINALSPILERKIGEYSTSLNRGKHQTKEVIIFPYEGGYFADTPGFSSLELNLYKEDLKTYFPFFTLQEEDCFFLDCHHVNEPRCQIKKLVEENIIPLEHYQNYLQIYDELIFRKDRFQ